MVATTNHKNANSSLNYHVIMMVQNLKKKSKSRISKKNSHFRGTKCRVEANNNRFAVVVFARHVVKRPSKRSALVVKKLIDLETDTKLRELSYISALRLLGRFTTSHTNNNREAVVVCFNSALCASEMRKKWKFKILNYFSNLAPS